MTTQKSPARVLVIDDDEDDFILVRDLLADPIENDWDLHWAPDSGTAKVHLLSSPPEVVLLDYRLGVEDGLDCLSDLKALDPHIPVILLTGQDAKGVDMTALSRGATDFLHKREIDAPSLERSLRYAIERSRAQLEIRRRDARFRSIFENASIGIALATIDGTIIEANSALARMLAADAETLVGSDMASLSSVKGGDTTLSWLAKVRRDDCRDYGVEAQITRQDGSTLWSRLTFVFVPEAEDDNVGLLVLIQDLSETQRRKALEKALEGLLPICSFCKRIRDDAGDWQDLEEYIGVRSDAEFTHSVCSSCSAEHYGLRYDGPNQEHPAG